MWTGVLLGILFMIYGRVQQPATAVSASQAHFMEQMKTFQLGAMRRDVWTGRMWFRGMRLPVALLWSTLINLFIIEMRQEGRKEGRNFAYGHTLSRRLFFPSSACDVGEGGDRVSLVRRSHYWTGIELPVVVGVTLFESNGSHLNLWLD